MSVIPLTGVGGVFSRWGAIGTEYLRVVGDYGTSLNNGVSAIWAEYPLGSEPATAAVTNLINAANTSRTANTPYLSELQNECINTAVLQVNENVPLQPYTLQNALGTLIGQMVASGQSIQRPTTSATVTPLGTNKGDAIFVASLSNNLGDPLDLVVAETVTLTCTQDSSTGAPAFSEVFTYNGEPVVAITNYLWPQGSAANGNVKLTDAFVTGLIQDGGFQAWTGVGMNTPTYWSIVTGATQITRNTTGTNILRGTSTIQIASNGTTLTELQQALLNPQPLTVYAVNFWAKVSSDDASGEFQVRLCNGTGTTLTNSDGSNLAATIATNGGSGIGTAFTPFTFFWATGRQLPTSGGVFLDFAYTTSPASGVNLWIDLVGIAPATQLYGGGVYMAGFSKSSQSARGDIYTNVVTNNAPTNSFSSYTNRVFNMPQLGLYFPSASSPTISDNLI
jgi:hypothetical protein